MDEPYERLQRLFDLVAGAEPAELRDGYLAHPAGDRPQAPGTAVPIVGQRFVRADSGLLIPPGAAGHGFTDTMRTYLTGREVFGFAIPDSEVLRALQANTAEDFLVVTLGPLRGAGWLPALDERDGRAPSTAQTQRSRTPACCSSCPCVPLVASLSSWQLVVRR